MSMIDSPFALFDMYDFLLFVACAGKYFGVMYWLVGGLE